VVADLLHDLQPGQNSALGVVFVGHRRSEKRQQAVPHQARHGALVVIDRADHMLEGVIDHFCPFFGVQPAGGCGRVFHIAEQHRYHAALPHQAAAGLLDAAHQLIGDELVQDGLGG
jgi:hypothetical protein